MLNGEIVKDKERELALTIAVQLGTDILQGIIGTEIGAYDKANPIQSSADLISTSFISAVKGA